MSISIKVINELIIKFVHPPLHASLTTCRCFQFQLHATLDGAAIDSARAIDQIKACANAVAVMPSEENQFEAAFFDKVLLTESVQGRVSSSIAPRRLSLHALLPALET